MNDMTRQRLADAGAELWVSLEVDRVMRMPHSVPEPDHFAEQVNRLEKYVLLILRSLGQDEAS